MKKTDKKDIVTIAVSGALIVALVALVSVSFLSFYHADANASVQQMVQDKGSDLVTMKGELRKLKRKARLVSFIASRARGIHGTQPADIVETLLLQEKQYGIPPALLLALIQVESSFRNYAVSSAGAMGLMQLQPVTAEMLCEELGLEWQGPHSLFNPQFNITLAAYYLDQLSRRFQNFNLALEAYNKGPTRVTNQLAMGVQVEGVYSTNISVFSTEFLSELRREAGV